MALKEHTTGAQRDDDANVVALDCLSWDAIRRLGITMAEGAKKYSKDNWRKGFSWRDCWNHAARHLFLWLAGDTKEDHLAHAMANLMFLMEFEQTHPELDDRYTAKPEETLRRNCVPVVDNHDALAGLVDGETPQYFMCLVGGCNTLLASKDDSCPKCNA